MPALRDVAEKAGVSPATASRVLNGSSVVSEKLRRRVLEAAETIRYRSGVGKKSADNIALLFLYSYRKDLSSPYEAACVDGLVAAKENSGYDLLITDVNRDRFPGESMAQFFARKGISGAVVRSTRGQRGMIDEIAATGLPLVLLGDHFEGCNLSSFFSESKSASKEAISHLVELGHQEIAFASCDLSDGDHIDRLNAYKEVMFEHGLYDERLVHLLPPSRYNGTQLARKILSGGNRPTALFVADPLVALTVLREAHRLGVRVPEEFSVVGVDDTNLRKISTPMMTAVVQDTKRLGVEAFQAVVEAIKNGGKTNEAANRVSCWFEIHDSTAVAPDHTLQITKPTRRKSS